LGAFDLVEEIPIVFWLKPAYQQPAYTLEITEEIMLIDDESTIVMLTQLKKGIQISIDDF
jgi:EAL domain-containing protein (putative c-di-GMP-specific phosphodiesterase class I)